MARLRILKDLDGVTSMRCHCNTLTVYRNRDLGYPNNELPSSYRDVASFQPE